MVTTKEPVIVSVDFIEESFETSVYARLSDQSNSVVFQYYADELSFSENELLNLTIKEAKELRLRKDKLFLRA